MGDEWTLNGCRTDIEQERNGNRRSVEQAVYGKFFFDVYCTSPKTGLRKYKVKKDWPLSDCMSMFTDKLCA